MACLRSLSHILPSYCVVEVRACAGARPALRRLAISYHKYPYLYCTNQRAALQCFARSLRGGVPPKSSIAQRAEGFGGSIFLQVQGSGSKFPALHTLHTFHTLHFPLEERKRKCQMQ